MNEGRTDEGDNPSIEVGDSLIAITVSARLAACMQILDGSIRGEVHHTVDAAVDLAERLQLLVELLSSLIHELPAADSGLASGQKYLEKAILEVKNGLEFVANAASCQDRDADDSSPNIVLDAHYQASGAATRARECLVTWQVSLIQLLPFENNHIYQQILNKELVNRAVPTGFRNRLQCLIAEDTDSLTVALSYDDAAQICFKSRRLYWLWYMAATLDPSLGNSYTGRVLEMYGQARVRLDALRKTEDSRTGRLVSRFLDSVEDRLSHLKRDAQPLSDCCAYPALSGV
jgi:hypothetical protein